MTGSAVDIEDIVGDLRPELLVRRAVRAAQLDRATYEEVEHDERATGQAGLIVLLGGLASGIWGFLNLSGGGNPGDILLFTFADLLGWGGYAYMAFLIGTTFLRGRETDADAGQLARTLGFASAPRLLLFLPIGSFAAFVELWHLIATVVAVRAALDIGTLRAVIVAIVSSFTLALIEFPLSMILAPIS